MISLYGKSWLEKCEIWDLEDKANKANRKSKALAEENNDFWYAQFAQTWRNIAIHYFATYGQNVNQ